MLLYYYTQLNQIVMWYYDENMNVRLWVIGLSPYDHANQDCKAAHKTLSARREANHLEDEGWCELLYDSGDD